MSKLGLFIILIFFSAKAMCDGFCPLFLNESLSFDAEDSIDVTSSFIAYLRNLLEIGEINSDYIASILNNIEHGKSLPNPFVDNAETQSSKIIHRQFLQTYLDLDLDKNKIKKWAQKYLGHFKKVEVQKNEVREETLHTHAQFKFYKIKGGIFKRQVSVEKFGKRASGVRGPYWILDIGDFEMMPTAITHFMWEKLTNEGSSISEADENALEKPKTNITWWSVAKLANDLSIKAGYKPCYNFNEIAFKGDLHKGNLTPVDSEKALRLINDLWTRDSDVIINPHSCDGYRLPTIYEQAYVGYNKDVGWPFEKNLDDLKNYIHFQADPNNLDLKDILPVGSLAEFIIDDQPFYDLYGNIDEMTHITANIGGSEHYHGPFIGYYVQRNRFDRRCLDNIGGHYKVGHFDEPNALTGFRFVRTLK